MAVLELKEIKKTFGSVKAVNALSLEIQKGEVFTLLGPSGCGKTTTLRLVAGLEEPDYGEIFYQDQPIVSISRGIFVPPHKRQMGMVFQSYAIWPNMTVYENVYYPLRLRRIAARAAREKVLKALDLVGLSGLEDRPTPLLSGGQQQRVALARALVYEPALLLLDEPFSNLDAKLREQMRVEVKLLQRKLAVTVLFVTHDQVEALSLSNRIAVLNHGEVEQVGAPSELYQQPQTSFVRDFLGKTVVLRGQILRRDDDKMVQIKIAGIDHPLICGAGPLADVGGEVYVAIRPEDIVVNPGPDHQQGQNVLKGAIETLLFVGDRCEVRLELEGGGRILSYISGRQKLSEGQEVRVKFPQEVISLWPASEKLS